MPQNIHSHSVRLLTEQPQKRAYNQLSISRGMEQYRAKIRIVNNQPISRTADTAVS